MFGIFQFYFFLLLGNEHQHWRMLMSYLRTFWHFMPQNRLHQKIVYPTIAKFFAIVLQYNSKVRIVLQQYSKYIYIFYSLFPPKFLSPQSHYFSSLLSLPSLFLHLLSPLYRPKHHSSFFVVAFFIFWVWVMAWISGGCGFQHGSLWWLWFFFFFRL